MLDNPNGYQSGMELRETLTASMLLWGNGYARIERNRAGDLAALHAIHPRSVNIVKLDSGRYRYDWTDSDGVLHRALQDEILHVRDRTDPGCIVGKSRIEIARETLGFASAMREHGAGMYRQGVQPNGVLTYSGKDSLSPAQLLDARKMMEKYQGTRNAGRFLLLSGGFEWKQLGMSMIDAEFVNTMKFSVEEIARLYRVPPTMIGDLSRGTFTNVQEMSINFVKYSLQRWLTVWESAISGQLLGPIARGRYFAEHAVEGLLRGQPEARADFYGKAIKDGWMTAEEVRRLENLPPLEKNDEPANGA